MWESNSHLMKIYFTLDKRKENKREGTNIENNYNKQIQSKMVDTGVQVKCHEDLLCVIGKAEQSEQE